MENTTCPMCRRSDADLVFVGRDYLHGVAGEFPVMRCQKCGVVYVNPRPSRSEIGQYYPPEYTPHDWAVRSNRHWWSRLDYRYGLDKRCRTVMRYRRSGRLLDVGCATGEFLARARELGWEVYGTELSVRAAAYARKQWGLEVFVGEIEAVPFPDGFFDAITLWNVFEHLFDPSASLAKMSSLLAAGGVLVMTVPNLDSLDLKLFAQTWIGYEVPRHFHLFPLAALDEFVRRYGFKVVDVRCLYGSYHAFFASLQFYFRERGNVRALRWAQRLARSRLLRVLSVPYFFVLDRFQAGTVLTVTCQKQS